MKYLVIGLTYTCLFKN